MNSISPAYTSNEIERLRLLLEYMISEYGLDNSLVLLISQFLDEEINKVMQENKQW